MARAGWVSVAVVPDFSWPDAEVEIAWDGREFVLLPATERLACCAAIRTRAGERLADVGEHLLRLLSSLAWSEDAAIRLLTAPLREGRGRFAASTWVQVAPRPNLYLPAPIDPTARLALALYREGLSVDSYPFALLSFMKVLNLRESKGAGQKRWVNKAIPQLAAAAERVIELQAQGHHDIGDYLYKHGRCAVAHAFDPPVVDPDRLEDLVRMRDDLPLARALAAHCIQTEFAVLSDLTFRQAHQHATTFPAEWLKLVNGANRRKRYAH